MYGVFRIKDESLLLNKFMYYFLNGVIYVIRLTFDQ